MEWCPSLSDIQALDRLFQQLDLTREGKVHAKEAVPFLRKSNLNKDVLNKMWTWVDSGNTLVIDRYQFYKIMRLISVLQSPMYANYTPSSMNELYVTTATQLFPIVSNATSTQGMEWCPTLSDIQALDQLFQQLDLTREGKVHAKEAVPFLRKSNLNKDVLNKMWTWVDSGNTLVIDRYQFYKIMRLISVLQSPMYANYTPSSMNELYVTTATQQFVLPVMSGSTVPNAHIAPVISSTNGNIVNIPAAPADVQFSNFNSAITSPINSLPVVKSGLLYQNHIEVDLICLDSPEKVVTDAAISDSNDSTAVTALPVEIGNDEDEIGEFMSASILKEKGILDNITASLTPSKISNAETGSLVKTNSSNNIAATNLHVESNYGKSNDRISVFDEIVERDLQAHNEDWDDFADATNAASVGTTHSDASTLVDVVENVPTDLTVDSPVCNTVVDDSDFGDFESADAFGVPATSEDPIVEMPAAAFIDQVVVSSDDQVVVPSDDPFASIEPVVEDQVSDFVTSVSSKLDDNPTIESTVQDACEDSDNIISDVEKTETYADIADKESTQVDVDADDFGDFAAAEEVPTAVIGEDSTVSEVQEAVNVVVDSETASENVPNLGRASSASLISDLFDFDEPDPTPIPLVPLLQIPPNLSTSAKSTNIAPTNILDLFDTVSTAPSTSSNDAVQAEFDADFDADFDAFQSAPTAESTADSTSSTAFLPAAVTTPPMTINAAVTTPSVSINAAVTHPTSNNVAFTISELEVLSVTLSEKFLYEEAYQCILNALYVREIYELTEEKKVAVERDDLVLAIKLKNKISNLNSKLVSVEEEQKWYQMANYGGFTHLGESIEQMADLARSFDASLGNRFARKYIDNIPDPFTPLPQRMRFYASAKRCIKIITALYTTHNSLITYWRDMLTLVEECVGTSETALEQFNRLEVIDQNILLATEKMKTFLEGALCIARVGLYVAASCMEGMLQEELAMSVAAKITGFLADIEPVWTRCKEINSLKAIDLPILTLGEILDSALENSTTIGLEYCNLTLRPLVTKKSGTLIKLLGSSSLTITTIGVECTYLKEAFNFVNNYLGELPACEEIFR